MADNATTDPGSGGKTYRTLQDATTIDWPTGVCCYATTLSAGANVLEVVRPAKGLPIAFNTAKDGTGTDYRPLVDADGHVQVDVLSAASTAVTNAGTFAVQAAQSGTWNIATVTTVTTVSAVTDAQVQGKAAHDAAVSGNPLLLGGYASATAPTAVSADGDAVRLWADLSGRLQIGDGAGSLTVDAPVGTPVFVRLSDGTAAISTLPVSLASVPSHAVTNAGTFVVQVDGAALTSLQLIDDAVFMDNAAFTPGTSKLLAIGAEVDDTATALGIEGSLGALRMTTLRGLHVCVVDENDAGQTLVIDSSGKIGIGGNVAVWGAVSHDAVATGGASVPLLIGGYASAAAPTAVSADGDAVNGWFLRNGAQATVLTAAGALIGGDASNGLDVDVTRVTGTVTIAGAVTNAGTFAVQSTSVIPGTGATNLGKAIDTATGATDTGVLVLATRDDALSALTPIEGDNVQLRVDANGALWVIPSGTVTVSGTVTANAGTNLNTSALALETGGNLAAAAASLSVMDDWDNAASDGASVSGDVAHDSADAGEPVKLGAKATASVLGNTPVAANDRTNLFAGTDGVLIVREGTSLEDIISERATNTDGASTAMTGAFAATASQRIYLTDITLANSSASNITVDIRDGAAGAVLWTFPVPAGGGVTHRFGTPLRFSANTALAYDGSAAATTLSISVCGFKSKA